MQNKDLMFCSTVDCDQVLDIKDAKANKLKCIKCKKAICVKCKL